MSERLKPCPFCGCDAWLHGGGRIFHDGATGYRVECEGRCHAMTCWWHSQAEAVEAWNTRSEPTPQVLGGGDKGSAGSDLSPASWSPEQSQAGGGDITITRAEARRLVNYAFMASSANWTPYIRENGVGYQESPWAEFLRIADRLWTVLFPDHPIRQIDPRLPADAGLSGAQRSELSKTAPDEPLPTPPDSEG